jgi:hypothetical protein
MHLYIFSTHGNWYALSKFTHAGRVSTGSEFSWESSVNIFLQSVGERGDFIHVFANENHIVLPVVWTVLFLDVVYDLLKVAFISDISD